MSQIALSSVIAEQEAARAEQQSRDDIARAVKAVPKPKGTRIEKIRAIVEKHQAARVEGLYVDAFTAQMLVAVHDALNEENRAKFAALPLRKMVAVGWKLVKK